MVAGLLGSRSRSFVYIGALGGARRARGARTPEAKPREGSRMLLSSEERADLCEFLDIFQAEVEPIFVSRGYQKDTALYAYLNMRLTEALTALEDVDERDNFS